MSSSAEPTQSTLPAAGAPAGSRPRLVLALLAVAVLVAAVATLLIGSVSLPLGDTLRILFGGGEESRWRPIVLDSRVPLTVTALVVGAGLGVAGLQMQTLFRNPLADPYILGASSGASLGVAVVVLAAGGSTVGFTTGLGLAGKYQTVVAAALGALTVLGLVLVLSRWVRSAVTLLLVGVMLAAGSTALVAVLIAYANPQVAQQFLLWGMGSFTATARPDLWILVPVVIVGIVIGSAGVRSLNALLLGEGYARSMGISIRRTRIQIIVSVALLAGGITAFCGPIGFLGLVVPHLARMSTGTADHRVLLPASMLMGSTMALVCGLIAQLPGASGVLPLGAVTALFGAPIVIMVLVRGARGQAAAT